MTEAKEVTSVFKTLSKIDVSEHTEKRSGMTYLSWAMAWTEFKTVCPGAKYEIHMWYQGEETLRVPYLYDPKLGYLVMTTVTVGEESHDMWLFVMNGAYKAMKAEPYTYQTKGGEKTVEAATMFDINTTLMRCLVKNLAMFGLGLYIYAGEDLPSEAATGKAIDTAKAKLKKLKQKAIDRLKEIDLELVQKAFDEAGIDVADTVAEMVKAVETEEGLIDIGKRAVELERESEDADQRSEEEKAEEAEEKEDPKPKKKAPAKKKAEGKKAASKEDVAKANKAKADKKIADAEAKKKAEAEPAPSDEDPTADDSFVEPEGPDADIKAVKPADHAPAKDEMADSVYIDYIVDFFRKMIERTITADMLADYAGADTENWDDPTLQKLFGLYKQLNEDTASLADAFPKHYEG